MKPNAQIAGGAYGNLVPSEQRTCRWQLKAAVVGARGQQTVLYGQLLGPLKHFMKAPSGLDGAGHWQAVVGLDPQTPLLGRQAQCLLHVG